MFLSIIFLEDKHKIVLHLSIFYQYQQFFQHRICFSIQPPDYSDPWPTLARSTSFFLIMLFKYDYTLTRVVIRVIILKINDNRSYDTSIYTVFFAVFFFQFWPHVLLLLSTPLLYFSKAAYVSSLASFNRKVVLPLATKPLTCAHINSIGLSS